MSAAALVADLLRESGLTKSALASKAGISRSSLDEWLKGERQPSIAQLERLGEAAGRGLDVAWSRPIEWRERPSGESRRTLQEKARILEVVTAMAMALPSKARGPLRYPSLRDLARTS